jgi:hypothetical protein
VSILGISADSKTYDSTTTATFSGTSLTSGASTSTDYKIYSSDASLVSLDTSGATGVFSNKNVANGISVSAGGFALSGAKASNYSLSQPSGLTANITPTLGLTNPYRHLLHRVWSAVRLPPFSREYR